MKRIILLIFAGFMITGCSTAYRNIMVQTPDLAQITDGVYRGFYNQSGTPVRVTLDVHVQDGRITGIEIIEHRSSSRGKKAEGIVETVVKKQSLEVDAVGGATASSNAILKAIEIALQ